MTASTIGETIGETIGISATAPVIGGLVAALLFAVANNVQRHAASAVPHGHVGPMGLLLRLMRNPRWLAGSSAALLALVVQAWALSQGGVILVQAVIASTLVWSLALEAIMERRWPSATQVAGAALVGTGIAVLVLVGKPGAGGEFRSLGRAAIIWGVVGLVGTAALLTSRRRPKGRRTAIVMGAAAGVCFALDAVFLRGLTATLSPIVLLPLLINLAGFGVASLLGNLVIQRAFQLAPLRHVLPAMAAAEPVTAFLCGRFVFGERLQGGLTGALGVGGGLLLMVCGVVLCALGRAPAESAGARGGDRPGDDDDCPPPPVLGIGLPVDGTGTAKRRQGATEVGAWPAGGADAPARRAGSADAPQHGR